MVSPPPTPSPRGRNDFDVRSFCDRMYYHGVVYRHRSMEVIETCRCFSKASKQSFDQVTALLRVQAACDEFLARAVDAKKRERADVDHQFDVAARFLRDYCGEFHKSNMLDGVMESMEKAKEKDKDDKKKKQKRSKATDRSLMVVCFHILRSPNGDPTIVRQALPRGSKIGEILWNFGHHKGDERLTLEQNPHFYCKLPTCSTEDVDRFMSQPTGSFEGTIFVLTNNSRRIFFDVGKKQRAFDNVWYTNGTLIFQDISGELEGEAIVKESTIGNRLLVWTAMPPLMQPTMQVEVKDWTRQIRGLLDARNTTHPICTGTSSP